jgi:tetratricopeptide (TPR) repeat protein
MKKVALFVLLAMMATMGFAQKNVRQTASNLLKDGKLDKAAEAINQCIQDPSTQQDAKSWLIRGNIYLELANTKDENFKKVDPDPLSKAMESYKKAYEFDTKKEFTDEIAAKLNWQRNNYFNSAVEFYNTKKYKEAVQAFENGAATYAAMNATDTISLFYAAACASLDQDRAKAKDLYLQLVKLNYRQPNIYISLSDIYRQEKDSSNALKVARYGQKMFPNDLKLFLAETNIYLTFGNTDKALQNLKLAAQKDTTNATVFFALGTIYDKIANDSAASEKDRSMAFDEAVKSYKTAIRLNPSYFDPNYNLGALYVNSAANINDAANKLPLDAEAQFKVLKDKANQYLIQAAPYLERASEINPTDLNTLYSLKQIYVRSNQSDKVKAVQAKIDAIQKK